MSAGIRYWDVSITVSTLPVSLKADQMSGASPPALKTEGVYKDSSDAQ